MTFQKSLTWWVSLSITDHRWPDLSKKVLHPFEQTNGLQSKWPKEANHYCRLIRYYSFYWSLPGSNSNRKKGQVVRPVAKGYEKWSQQRVRHPSNLSTVVSFFDPKRFTLCALPFLRGYKFLRETFANGQSKNCVSRGLTFANGWQKI